MNFKDLNAVLNAVLNAELRNQTDYNGFKAMLDFVHQHSTNILEKERIISNLETYTLLNPKDIVPKGIYETIENKYEGMSR